MLSCTAQPEHMASAPQPHRASCLGSEQGCAAFKCLVHLWDWLDPPTLIPSTSMDSNKGQPTTQQPLHQRSVQHLHANSPPTLAVRLNSAQPNQLPPNGIVHQLLMQSPGYYQHSSNTSQDVRTPLLENPHELYGTQHLSDYAKPRQYGTRERENLYSPQSPPSQIPINYDALNNKAASNVVPPGYNVDVHNAYLLRNPPKDQNQIYQNHQGVYRSPEEYGSNSYLPYTNRLQAPIQSNMEMLKQQYNDIQQMRLQQQMHYQNQAQMQQQQIFAQRQLLLQHMHGIQPPPNLRQDLEVMPSKESDGNKNKKSYEMPLGKEESYGQNLFYGKDLSYEKDQLNYQDTYSREHTASKEYKEPVNNTINLQRNNPALKRESRERDRYQAHSQQMSSPSSKSADSTNPSIKSPSSDSRRSSSGNQALKSPIAQRPASAPVAMAGWLYKQGSDGLRVWRKRWFVLSEYCLFYYKSQDEDKLLGSVLLPSYEVRACGAEERVSRKWAFKCEHANMRTLLLAAPDQALMQAWLRALTCAALMQEGSVIHEPINISNEVPGEYGQEVDNDISEEDGSPGHTYANAPPKPRRSNDGYNSPSPERYESNYDLLRKPPSCYNPINDTLTQSESIYDKRPKENYSDPALTQSYQTPLKKPLGSSGAETLENSRSQIYKQRNDQRESAKSPIYFDGMTKNINNRTDQLPHDQIPERSQGLRKLQDESTLRDLKNWNIYDSRNIDGEIAYKRSHVPELSYKLPTDSNLSEMRQSQLDVHNLNVHTMNSEDDKRPFFDASNNNASERIERRTPDAYGRSAIVPGYNSNGKSSDYEDIYPKYSPGKEYRSSYKTEVNSDVYGEKGENYNQNVYERNRHTPTQSVQYVPSVLRRTKAQSVKSQSDSVMRPHSADFLQHPHSAPPPTNAPHPTHTTQRPKSSLDINSFYDPSSDSYYSEESYAAKMRQSAQYLRSSGAPSQLLDFHDDKLYSPSNPNSYSTNDRSTSDLRVGVNTSNYIIPDRDNVSYDSSKFADSSSLNSNWTLKDNRKLSLENESCNRSNSATGESFKASEGFVRSASARLPSDNQENKDEEKKVHQREESMKRLLEWKQRMLQSPLTRKSTPAALTLARSLHRALPPQQQLQEQTADVIRSQPSEQAGRPPDPPLTLSAPSTMSLRQRHVPKEALMKDESTLPSVKLTGDIDIKCAETLFMEENLLIANVPNERYLDVVESKTYFEISNESGKIYAERSPMDTHSTRQVRKAEMYIDDKNIKSSTNKVYIGKQVQSMQKLDIIASKPYPDYEIISSQSLEDDGNDQGSKPIPSENEAESATDGIEYTDDDLDEVLMNSDEEKGSAECRNFNDPNSESQEIVKEEQNTNNIQDQNCRDNLEDNTIMNVKRQTLTEPTTNTESNVSMRIATTNVSLPLEDHYLPMTPRKSAHINTFNSFNSVFESGYSGGHEDNNYVEMSQGMAIENVFGHDAYEVVCVNNGRAEPVYMELTMPDQDVVANVQNPPEPPEPNQKDAQSSQSNISEGNTMDKSTLKRGDKPKRDEALKSPLPDIILNSTKSILKSDSSDADDEASKDFSRDRPFSRFSLSDTFRPASYYLGSSGTLLELQDSSDSEIVSPPPVPASSPPVEDLDSVMTLVHNQKDERSFLPTVSDLDNHCGYSNFDTIKRKTTSLMIYGSTPSVHDTLFRGEKIRHSRASLTNDGKIKENMEKLSSSNSGFFKSETDSILSFNADRSSSKMSLDSDVSSKFDAVTSQLSCEIMSLKNESVLATTPGDELERMSKRRPLSDESFLDVDKYLDNLQLTDLPISEIDGSFYDRLVIRYDSIQPDSEAVGYYNQRVAAIREERQYENINIQESLKIAHSRSMSSPVTSSRNPILRPLSSCSVTSSNIRNTPKVSSENNTMIDKEKYCELSNVHVNHEEIPMSYYSKSVLSDDEIIDKNLYKYNLNYGTLNKVKTASVEDTILKTSPESKPSEQNANRSVNSNKGSDISHSRDSSTEHSAPYYYSDLSSQEHIDMNATPHYSKSNNLNKKLNNQRMSKGSASRKNEITHIHNPIHSNLVTNQLHGLNDESFEIAAAARSVTVEFLCAADKTAEIDVKNIYESDTVRRQKNRHSSSSLHSTDNFNNIYPHVTDSNSILSAINSRESNQSCNFSFNDSRVSSVRNDSPQTYFDSPNRSTSRIDEVCCNNSSSSNNSNLFNSHQSVQEVTSSLTGRQELEREQYTASTSVCEADKLWDEDTLWRENLRRASQRHARSMDNLDCLSNSDQRERPVSGRFSVDLKTMHCSKNTSETIKPKSGKIRRTVTYVNDDSAMTDTSKRKIYENKVANPKSELKQDENDVYVQLVSEKFTTRPIREMLDEGVYEQLAIESAVHKSNANISKVSEAPANLINSSEVTSFNEVKSSDSIGVSGGLKKRFEIDREKLRQWDLMSSGLMKNEWYKVGAVGGVSGLSVGNAGQMDNGRRVNDRGDGDLLDHASFMDEEERGASRMGNEASASPSVSGHRQLQTPNKKSLGGSNPSISRPARDTIPIRAVSPRVRWATEKPSQDQGRDDIWNGPQDTSGVVGVGSGADNVSWAGVGGACALLGRSHGELQELLVELRRRHMAHAGDVHHTMQQIRHLQNALSTPEYMDNRQEKLEQLEKLKLHLVELEKQYSASRPLMQLVDSMVRLGALYPRAATQPAALDRLERNQRARQQLLLEQAQEQRRLAESTENLSRDQIQRKMEQLWALDRELSSETGTLQELKADKEAIEKVLGGVREKMDWSGGASEWDASADDKLAHVYTMLAHNSKKLEQTVGDNARLERELAALRDSLQGHTTHRTTALLEDELRRVRQLVWELQRQRQELSCAVRRLTESAHLVAATPAGSLYKKRTANMSWLETDLDSGRCVEHGADEPLTPPTYAMSAGRNHSPTWMSGVEEARQQMTPLYVDTRPSEPDMDTVLSPTTSDDGTQNGFGNLTNVEKQEIKTVRIVKRESERRQRDRDRSLQPYPGDWSQPLHPMDLNHSMNQDEHYVRAASLPRTAFSNVQPNRHNTQLDNNGHSALPMGLSLSNKTQPPSHLSLSNVNVPQNSSSSWEYENSKYQSSPSLPINNKDNSWFGSQTTYNEYASASNRGSVSGTAKASSCYGDIVTEHNRTTSNVPLSKTSSVASLSSSVSALSPPAFSSEAARQIMSEVRAPPASLAAPQRRAVPREKRRHHTAPLRLSADALQQLPKSDGFDYLEKKSTGGRWLDDTDMERALRGSGRDELGGTEQDRPDVVRCAAPPVTRLTDATLIDQLLAAPRKILIPERYIPEKPPELSQEEQQKRLEKVESIKKMLSSGATSSDPAKHSPGGDDKKQREHLLHMNQILAQQVMQMSKIVAVKALQNIPIDESYGSDSEDRSPDVELPIYQKRDNFFT